MAEEEFSIPGSTTVADSLEERRRAGFVYLLCSETGLWKIGASHEPEERLSAFSRGPAAVFFVHSIPTASMRRLEDALHTRYADRRVRGEWFALAPADVAEICAIRTDHAGLQAAALSPPRPCLNQIIAANVQRLRLGRSLSLEDLARRSGLSRKLVGRVEAAAAAGPYRSDTLRGIANALGVSVPELYASPPIN